MLYFSIASLVVMSFFPVLQRYTPNTSDRYFQIDNSLLTLMIDNLLNAEDSESDASDTSDDDSTSTDFLSAHLNNWTVNNAFSVERKKIPTNNSFPESFPLKKFTPPPKV